MGLRLDQHAGPTALFEMPCFRVQLRIVGAHFYEVAGVLAREECLLELGFCLVGQYCAPINVRRVARHCAHRFGANDGLAAGFGGAGRRGRSTNALVEWPGTSSTSSTLPPAASTTSRPTTSSMR